MTYAYPTHKHDILQSMVSAKRLYVHQAFDEGYICVFPTEVAARAYLVDYALHSEKQAILSSKAISYDIFRAQFLPHHNEKRPANTLIRELFIHQFLEAGNRLHYFLNPEYPESDTRFSSYLAKILPSLSLCLDTELLSQLDTSMVEDLFLLYQSYMQFLDEHMLFEPRYEQCSQPSDWDDSKRYCILFSDTIADAEQLYNKLGRPQYLKLIPTPITESWTALEVFPNHLQEIHTTLRRIRALLEEGVPTYAIGIGLSANEVMNPILLQEAKLYDIPLTIREGKSALHYSSGRFFSLLKNVYDEQFSLESLKSLFLDLAIPFKDRALLHLFLKAAVRASIMQGSLDANDRFIQNLKDPSLVSWYRRFKRSVIEIVTSEDLEELRRKLNHFQDTYFTEQQWVGSEGEAVYAFCMDALDDIKDAIHLCGLHRYSGLYSFYISHLERKQYVPQATQGGIAVYAWPQVAPLPFDHLFVLALDQESSSVVDSPLAFLPQTIDSRFRQEVDTTKANFAALQLSLGQLTPSCHLRRYEGEQLPCSLFLEADRLTHHIQSPNLDEDPFLAELALFSSGQEPRVKATGLQRTWFGQAKQTALQLRSDDYTRHPVPQSLCSRLFGQNDLLSVSPTSLDLFNRCPYAFLAKYLYRVDQAEYDVQMVDHRTIGILLHAIYQQFFSNVQRFDPSKIASYTDQLLSLFDSTLISLYGEQGPTPSSRNWIIAQDRKQILSILEQEEQLFSHGLSIAFEQAYEFEQPPLLLTGRIDRVIRLTNDDPKGLAVIDYKKGSVEFKQLKNGIKSYQLLLYQALLEKTTDEKVANASYYSIKDGRYYSLWEDAESEEAHFCRDALDEKLQILVQDLAVGNLSATPSKDHCKECVYRALCRRRYATE